MKFPLSFFNISQILKGLQVIHTDMPCVLTFIGSLLLYPESLLGFKSVNHDAS